MRRKLLVILITALTGITASANTLEVPLRMSRIMYLPADNPTGSTPDPTDPTQFRVTLTGNTLTVTTQSDQVSYVVVGSNFCEKNDENYFFSLSYDSISCPLTRPGEYTISIGNHDTDFMGKIRVKAIRLYTLSGIPIQQKETDLAGLAPGWYVLRVETDLGTTTVKLLKQ